MKPTTADNTNLFPDKLVSSGWLEEHLDEPNMVILDCTNFAAPRQNTGGYFTLSGRKAWSQQHIPGSAHADFATRLCGDNIRYRNALPSPEKFVAEMGKLGIGEESIVVLYDSAGSMWAARVWWMLRWVGFDNAAILNGGFGCWKAQSRPISTGKSDRNPKKLELRLRPEVFVDKDFVMHSLNDRSIDLIDALSENQFNGKQSDLGLAGHIPGAINIPATDLLEADTGCYLPDEQLVDFFPQSREDSTIVYCGSGIAAASTAFTMNRLGYNAVSIYMPGLQEWVLDKNAPLTNALYD